MAQNDTDSPEIGSGMFIKNLSGRLQNSRHLLYAILAFALIARLGFGLTRTDLTDSADEALWDGLGRSFAHLGIFHPDTGVYRPPLYGLMLAGIYSMVGHAIDAVRLLQAVIDTATCALLYMLGRRLGRAQVGLLAAGMGATYPLFIFFTGIVMAETLLVFLTTASIFLFLRFWDDPTYQRAASFGAAIGLSALCKPVLLPYLPLVLIWWWRSTDWTPVKKATRAAAVIGATSLMILPWTLRNHAISGHYVLISANTGINFLIGAMPESKGMYNAHIDYLQVYRDLSGSLDFAANDRKVIAMVLGWIAADPIQFAGLCLRKMFCFWSPVAPGESIFRNVVALGTSGPLLFLGIVGAVRLRQRPEGSAICLLMIAMSILHILFFAHTRFRLPIDAALCLSAAWMIDGWWRTRSAAHGV